MAFMKGKLWELNDIKVSGSSVKILFIHPRYRDYRARLFADLNKLYDIKFLFIKKEHPYQKIPPEFDSKSLNLNGIGIRDFNLSAFKRYIKELLKKDYDIILTSIPSSIHSHIAFLLAKITGKKIIMWVEEWHWDANANSYLKKLLKQLLHSYSKFLLKNADACIVQGSLTKEFCLNIGVSRENIFVAPVCAVDYSKMPSGDLRKKLHLEDKEIILYFNRIIQLKGLDYLIKSFALLEKQMHNVFLLIAGDGPFKGECERIARNLNIKNILFVGWVDNTKQAADYYKACDIFVLPSIFLGGQYEGWGLVINEAMAFGKPIVTTDAVGAAPDMVKDGINGYVVKNKNIDELYKALYKILSDDKLKEKMSENSRKIFEEKNDFEKMYEEFKNAIEYVKQKRKGDKT